MEDKKDLQPSSTRESIIRLSTSKPYFTETIYQNQKKQISDINEKYKVNSQSGSLGINDTELEFNKYIIFNDINQDSNKINWQYAMFETDIICNEESPLIKSNWSESDIEQNSKGIELRNLIFRSNDNINLIDKASDIYFDIVLKGESSFWLILRSSNELNKYSSILKLSKDNNSQKVFVSYGTFVIDHNGKSIFKVFLKQQLINYHRNVKNKSYYDNDMCEIRANVFDNGDDKIKAKIFLNESRTDNSILGSFFLPIYDKSKIMIAGKTTIILGSGHSILVKAFFVRQVNRINDNNENRDSNPNNNNNINPNDRRNCDCCLII